MSDRALAQVARSLAVALLAWAHDRRDDDKKKIAELHRELCETWRKEQLEKKG